MPNNQDPVHIAIDAIGAGDSENDWKITPTEHAEMFDDKAPSLAQNLRGARPKGLAELFEEADNKAVKTRDTFKNTFGKANKTVFATAGCGALLMISGGLHSSLGDHGVWVVRGLGLGGLFFSGLAAMWINRVQSGKLLHHWLEARAKAEAKRLLYFKTVLKAAPPNVQDQLYVFEYVRRFLLDNQIDYFKERGEQHEQADSIAIKNSSFTIFLSSAITAIAGGLSILITECALIAGLGAIATAYGALMKSQSEMNQDRKNAARYLAAKERLYNQKLALDDYRNRIAAGESVAVAEFFEPIFVALEADHHAFLSDQERRELAIGNMEKRLNTAKEALQS